MGETEIVSTILIVTILMSPIVPRMDRNSTILNDIILMSPIDPEWVEIEVVSTILNALTGSVLCY